ncbi:MAG: hypothetical protein IKW20_00055 [Bacteroidales bacterium]|nr:hypothetical protein [Bacteroidales bacterium]
MEINQTQERTVFNVTAEKDGWTINASVIVTDGKVTNLDGSVFRGEGAESVTLNAFRQGVKLTRTVHNVTDDTADVYGVVEDFVASIRAKYEGDK